MEEIEEYCRPVVIFFYVNNIIFLEFLNKKGFPPGKWLQEPDLCRWDHAGLSCLAIRDMSLGVWNGFVGVDSSHSFYSHSLDVILKSKDAFEIFFSVYGGISSAGKLPAKYKELSKNLWWLGIETSHGGDLMPLLKMDMSNPDMAKLLSGQTYKDFAFIRKETNKLAKCMSRIK